MNCLSSDIVYLRALEPDDLDSLYLWENDSSCWNSTNTDAPHSRFELKQYIESLGNDIFSQGYTKLLICRVSDNAKIGVLDIFNFDRRNSNAETGVYIDAAYRRQGYAKEAMGVAIKYLTGILDVRNVFCRVSVSNEASCGLFEKCGFSKIATLPSWLKEQGGFADANLYLFTSR